MGFAKFARKALAAIGLVKARPAARGPNADLMAAMVADAQAHPVAKRVFSPAALNDLASFFAMGGADQQQRDVWHAPVRPPWVEEWILKAREGEPVRLAMDSIPFDSLAQYANESSPWSEGLGFLGYAYLSELQQRPEYRRICEVWAAECTRKWIKIKGDDPDRVAKLEKLMLDFGVREKFREAIEIDGAQGRAHIFMDFGDKQYHRDGPIKYLPETIPVGGLKNIKVIEPFWVYPLQFGTNDPLADDFYVPSQWQVMTDTVHNTRLLTVVGRELPDILKPVYMFGGLSLSQMAKPYIDNFIRNRTSIGNLLHSFSTMVLATDLGAMLAPGAASEVINRIQAFIFGRETGGLMLVDKDTEALTNVSAQLAGTKDLLAQSQEFISSVTGIPLVVLLGTTPGGLNASAEPELVAFYAHIKGYQEKALQAPLSALMTVLQLHLDGVIDDSLTFEFVDLWELDDEAKARLRLANMQAATGYIAAGVLSPEDERERLEAEQGGMYFGMTLRDPPEDERDDPGGKGLDDPDEDDEGGADDGAPTNNTQEPGGITEGTGNAEADD